MDTELSPNDPQRKVRLDDVRALNHPFFRNDAASLWFQKELEHVIATQYEKRYPNLSMAEGAIIPMRATVPRGKKTGSYKMFEYTGVAKWLNTASWKDIPRASAKGKRATFEVHEYALGYGWNLGELEEAQATNTPLQQYEAAATRRGMALFLNEKGWHGDADKNTHGLLDLPNMTVIEAPQGAANAYRWSTTGSTSKTGREMVSDIALGIRTMRSVTNNVQRPTRVLLPSSYWERAQHTLLSGNTDTTVIEFLRKTYPDIEFREERELESAGNYDGPVILFLDVTSAEDLWLEVPIQFEQHGPFQDGLEYGVITRSSTGGVISPYPQAILRMDFAAD